jgi:hypothetical protein
MGHSKPTLNKGCYALFQMVEQGDLGVEKSSIVGKLDCSMEHEMGFGYRQGIGELIYALVTCRLDISFSVIKLSQYST